MNKMKVHIIKNVFSENKRKEFIECGQPLIVDGSRVGVFDKHSYPGRQSYATVHLHPDFIEGCKYMVSLIKKTIGLDLIIDRAWLNQTNGELNSSEWHNHPTIDYSAVYYMKTTPFFNSGTLFRDKFVRVPQNGLLVFPASLEHTAPSSFFHNPLKVERYTWVMDLNKKDSSIL